MKNSFFETDMDPKSRESAEPSSIFCLLPQAFPEAEAALHLHHEPGLCEMLLVPGNSKRKGAPQEWFSWVQRVWIAQAHSTRAQSKASEQRTERSTENKVCARQGKVIDQL